MSNRFYFGDDSLPTSQTPTAYSANDESNVASDDDDNDDDFDGATLPFPKPLSRPTFTTVTFEPHTFLASLSTSNRFQTLEDLQTELRELSATINRELVDLVNGNYEEFVSLGADLRGGDDKVEEIRVGLLGFEKDVTGLRDRVSRRRHEVEELMKQKRGFRKEIGLGRRLLEIDERLTELERRVGLDRDRRKDEKQEAAVDEDGGEKWSGDWDDESVQESDAEYEDDDGIPGRSRALVEHWLIVAALVKKCGPKHPFVASQRERMKRVHERIVVELETVIRGIEEAALKQKLIQLKTSVDESEMWKT